MLYEAIYIFMWKHLKYHLYHWRAKLITIILTTSIPIVIIFNLQKQAVMNGCLRADALPYMLVMCTLQMVSLMNLVLLPMIDETTTGIVEFLRIASKYSSLNVITFAGVQVLLSLVLFGLVLVVAVLRNLTGHFEMSCMLVLIVLHVLSSVALSMLMSVVFKEGLVYCREHIYCLFSCLA